MIHNKMFFLLFTLQLIGNNTFSQSGPAKSLEIGNKWVYQTSSSFMVPPYLIQEVVKDTIIKGKPYAVIAINFGQFSYERADSIKIYGYDIHNDSEYVLINFSQTDTLGIEVDTVYFWGSYRIEVCSNFWHPLNDITSCFVEGIGEFSYSSYSHGGSHYSYHIVAAYLNGIKYGDTVLVGVNKNEYLPTKYELFQNYPNPFNPKTTIRFSIPKTTQVILTIYNLSGENIINLIDQELFPGNYEYEFDGSDISSGVYFYQLRTNDFMNTKKFILIK